MYLMKHYFEQTWEMQSQENSDLQLKLKKLQASEPPGLDSKRARQGTMEPSVCRTSCIRFQSVFMLHITTVLMLLTTDDEEASRWV